MVALAAFVVHPNPFALGGTGTNLWLLGAVLFVRGLGLGIVFIPVVTVAYVDLRRDQMPQASAITRIVQRLGGAFGTALVAGILTAATTQTNPAAGFEAAFWWTIAMTVAAAVTALLLPGRERGMARVTEETGSHGTPVRTGPEAAS